MILEVPRLYIRNINDEVITTLDRGDYFNDTLTRFLAGKASVLEFTILKREGDYELFSAGKKISFKYEGEEFWLNMMISDQDEKELTVTALSLNLEMNNETTGPYTGKSLSFEHYFKDMVNYENSVIIGINEVSEKRISNEWTGTDTNLSRLFSLATVFGAELEFVSELNPNGSLKRIVMNVYKEHSDTVQGVGTDRRSETFRFGKDIKTVRKTEDASGVYTAIRPHGTDGLTVKDIEKEIFDENGVLLYCTYKTARPGFSSPHIIYAPQSRDVFPSTLSNEDDRWIVKDTEEMDYKSAEALFGYALGELKKNCVPQTEWEIEGYIPARIGDTIRVADNGYKPEIYLDARITEQTISFTDPSKNKSTFSNVVELQSKVSDDLLKVVADLKKEINYISSITTDYQVSNQGTTAPTGEWVVDKPDVTQGDWLWTRTTQDLTNGQSVVGFSVSRIGEDGKTPVKGEDYFDGKPGEDGVSPEITINPDTSLTIVDKAGTHTTPALQGPQGPMGVAYAQPDPPTGVKAGSTWFKTKSSADNSVIGIYTLIGTTWTQTPITPGALAVESLSALSANLGTVTAGTINGVNINGSVITNTFKNWETGIEFGSAGSGLYLGGTTTIRGGRVKIESKLHNKSGVQISPLQMFISTLGEEGIEYGTYDESGAKTLMQMMAGGLAVSDLTGSTPRSAVLTVDDIIKLKNFNEKTKVVFDAGYDYNKMPYPRETQKYTLGDITKIKWIIINWAMYNPSTGGSVAAHEQTILEYSSSSAAGSYRIVLPYDEKDGNSAAVMTIKRIHFPFENGTTYLQGDAINAGTFSKWWVMRKVIVVEG